MSYSWYRRNVWQFKGNREYTKSGYEAATFRFGGNELDVDCSDRHFMITGANSGIGLATAIEIARRGGILHLVCRNAKAMKEARSHIITTTGNDRIYQHQLNLAKPRDVARWAEFFLESYDQLDVLINNAGCMFPERVIDEDGIETNFAVNTLAVHIITVTLLPLMRRSKDPRVITVSSGGMLKVKLDPYDLSFENLDPYVGRIAYSQTKRQQVVMNFNYAQRFEAIKFFSMHPGWVDTPSVQNSLPEFYELMKDNLRTPLQGADTIIWLAISKAALQYSTGLFFQDRTPVPTHLPLAWTRPAVADEQLFMNQLDELFAKFCTVNQNSASNFPHDHFNESNSLNGGLVTSSDQVLSVEENAIENPFQDSVEDRLEKLPEDMNNLQTDIPEDGFKTQNTNIESINDSNNIQNGKCDNIKDKEEINVADYSEPKDSSIEIDKNKSTSDIETNLTSNTSNEEISVTTIEPLPNEGELESLKSDITGSDTTTNPEMSSVTIISDDVIPTNATDREIDTNKTQNTTFSNGIAETAKDLQHINLE